MLGCTDVSIVSGYMWWIHFCHASSSLLGRLFGSLWKTKLEFTMSVCVRKPVQRITVRHQEDVEWWQTVIAWDIFLYPILTLVFFSLPLVGMGYVRYTFLIWVNHQKPQSGVQELCVHCTCCTELGSVCYKEVLWSTRTCTCLSWQSMEKVLPLCNSPTFLP